MRKWVPSMGYALMSGVTWVVGIEILVQELCKNQCSTLQYIGHSTLMFLFAALWPLTWLMVGLGGLTKRLVE